ncbi:Ig-like domain-containing protein [Hymenobacter sp.]|uniref:Ig-like domain-containing protein n=1 Tax=Hymenobacter sp. TaxID=1898978 RepID=UPI00286C44E7|nr:Ig-like domain-containing protein [Hymenobacter sp.]
MKKFPPLFSVWRWLVLALVFAGPAPARAQALFEQNFESSTSTGSYVNSTAPTTGQFTYLNAYIGADVVRSIQNGALTIEKTTTSTAYGVITRNVDFPGPPQTLAYQVDVTVSGVTKTTSSGLTVGVGNGFANSVTNPASSVFYLRNGIRLDSAGGFTVGGQSFTGTRRLSYFLNNSGAVASYVAPDGSTQSVGNDQFDLWVDNARLITASAVTNAGQTLSELYLRIAPSAQGKVALDNFRVTSFAGGSGGTDTEAPTSPQQLATSDITGSAIRLAWASATDNIGVAGYKLFLDNALVTSVANSPYQFTGLSPATTYTLGVRAVDFAGNESALSTITAATTATAADTQAPTVPTNLQATAPTTDATTLTWSAATDNVGVTGYRVFRNGTFLADVPQSPYQAAGLTPGTAYTFEVSARDAAGNESARANVAVTTATPPAPTDAALNTFYGVHVGRDSDPAKSIASLRDVGAGWVRLFADVIDWADPTRNTSFAFTQAVAFKNAGFKVMVVLSANNGIMPASNAQAKAYFDWVQTQPGLNAAVDAWEIMNEVNLDKYWQGTEQEYVDLVLKAAWASFKPNGETVVGASFTLGQDTFGGTQSTERLIAAGYLDYCDYANLHPYATSFSELKNFTNKVLSLYGNKPVFIGEWNYKDNSFSSDASLANAITLAREYFATKPTLEAFMFYRHLESTSEGLYPSLVRNGPTYTASLPFYNMYKSWPKTPDLSNPAPSVQLMAPATGTTYEAGSSVTITAEAGDVGGNVTEVAFYHSGDQLIGSDTDGSDGWSFTWTNLPPGRFELSVLAKDNGGATRGAYGPVISAVANTTGKVLSINFQGSGQVLNPTDVAGVLPRANWNNSANVASTSDLLDEEGSNTGAKVTNTLPSNYRSADPTTSGDRKMMQGYIASFDGTTRSITVSNLPPIFADSLYDVYVYWGNQDGDNDYVRYSLNGRSFWLRDNTNRWDGTHTLSNAPSAETAVNGGSFVVFRGQTGATVKLDVRAYGTFRGGVSGIQIVRSNLSPQLGTVAITSPADGAIYQDQDDIALTASTTDFGPAVASVSFYANGATLIGTDTDGSDGWQVAWTAVPAGIYPVSAVATTATGLAVASFPVQLNVLGQAGDVISVSFKGLGAELTLTDVAGQVPAANWNNSDFNTSSFMVDARGNNTGAQISNTLPSAYKSSDAATSGDLKLMQGYVANFSSGTRTITVDNLPANFGAYDVYVYGSNNNSSNVVMGLEINGDTYFLRDNSATWSGVHRRSTARTQAEAQAGASYVLLEGVTGTSFTLKVTSYLGTTAGRIGINGIQIVRSNRASSSVVYPAPGGVYTVRDTVTLRATANNFDPAPVRRMAFYYDDDQLIGEDTDGSDGWSLLWTIPQARSYNITSVAYSDSTSGKSAPVNLRVRADRLEGVISVSFRGTGSDLVPADVAGAVPAANWNNSDSNATITGLVNAAGVATSAAISNDLPANYSSFDPATTADNKMMRGYIANFSGDAKSVTVRNLPALFTRGGYSLLVYWGNRDTDNDVVSYKVGSSTFFLRDSDERWDGLHTRSTATEQGVAKNGSNYVLFENLRDSTLVLEIASFNTFRAGISGLQIVAAPSVGEVQLLGLMSGTTYPACAPIALRAAPAGFAANVAAVRFVVNGSQTLNAANGPTGWSATFTPAQPGPYEVVAVAQDAAGTSATSAAATLAVTPDAEAPVIQAVAAITAPTDANTCGAVLNIAAPTVTDNCTQASIVGVRSDGLGLQAAYPTGSTRLTWTATDAAGNTATLEQLITVADQESPVLTAAAPASLRTPNHAYHSFAVTTMVTSAVDNCGPVAVRIVQVTSNESELGQDSGNTSADILISKDCQSVQVRAERQGYGNGRVYTVHLEGTDPSGNTSQMVYRVSVPYSASANAQVIDETVAYSVAGTCGNALRTTANASQTAGSSASNTSRASASQRSEFVLRGAFPNPSRALAAVTFDLPEAATVQVAVYNASGLQVLSIPDQRLEAGPSRTLQLDGTALPAGVYFYRVTAQGSQRAYGASGKLIIEK